MSAQQSVNRFEEADQGNGSAEESSYQAEAMLEENQQGQIVPGDPDDPGNPGDPVPIDDYIPLLVIAAAGIIAYKGYKKTQNA